MRLKIAHLLNSFCLPESAYTTHMPNKTAICHDLLLKNPSNTAFLYSTRHTRLLQLDCECECDLLRKPISHTFVSILLLSVP